jgi:O-antigen ligase
LLASGLLLVPLSRDVCLGWVDGHEDLDKCRQLDQVPGGSILGGAVLVIALAGAFLPKVAVRVAGVAQPAVLMGLALTTWDALQPLARLDPRVLALFLSSLASVAVSAGFAWRSHCDHGSDTSRG